METNLHIRASPQILVAHYKQNSQEQRQTILQLKNSSCWIFYHSCHCAANPGEELPRKIILKPVNPWVLWQYSYFRPLSRRKPKRVRVGKLPKKNFSRPYNRVWELSPLSLAMPCITIFQYVHSLLLHEHAILTEFSSSPVPDIPRPYSAALNFLFHYFTFRPGSIRRLNFWVNFLCWWKEVFLPSEDKRGRQSLEWKSELVNRKFFIRIVFLLDIQFHWSSSLSCQFGRRLCTWANWRKDWEMPRFNCHLEFSYQQG